MATPETTQAQLDANPEIQDFLREYTRRTQGLGIGAKGREFAQAAPTSAAIRERAGIAIPKGYNFDVGSGKVVKETGIPGWAWALPAAAFAPMAIGALAGGAGAGAGAAASASALPGASAAPSLSSLLGAAPVAAKGSTGMVGTLLGLGKDLLKNPKDLISGIGSALGAGSQASADNRGTMLEAMIEQERLRQEQMRNYYDASRTAFDTEMSRGKEVRDAEGDAWKKLQQAAYVGGAPASASLGLAGPYSRSVAGPSSSERGAASDFEAEMVKRMKTLGGQYALPNAIAAPEKQAPYELPMDLLKPGMWEKISGYVGAGLKGLGGIPKETK